MPDFPTAGPFVGITATDGPSGSALDSLIASFQSQFTQTTGGSEAQISTPEPTSEQASSTSKEESSSTIAATSRTPTTLETSIVSSADSNTPVSSSSDSPSVTGENAASNTNGENPTVSEKDCDSISCNSGLQAAIAVPVVVGVLLVIAIFFFLRRRRRNRQSQPVSEKHEPVKKKWSRHLRVFSFDAELLMGGFRSSSNSVRSRQTGSVRSAQGSGHAQSPSLHSIDEVAPPYRDTVTTAQAPTGQTPDPYNRPSSTATAPPPYAAAPGNTSRQSRRPTTPRDPFADASPISPIEASPFDHPEDDASSMQRSINDDGGSTLAGSETGSIREAQLGRNLSVMSGGRTINNVRDNSS